MSIKKSWGDHEFTESELKKLFNDETIEFKTSKGQIVRGKLENAEYKGYAYVQFKGEYQRDDSNRFKGVWNGKEISISRKWSTYEFNDEELQNLMDGKIITINYKNKHGYVNPLKGRLEEQTYNSNKFVGFKPIFEKKD